MAEYHSDPAFESAFGAVAKDVEGANMSLESVLEKVREGDVTAARAELHMGLRRRLRDAEEEALGLDEQLQRLGGVYPPPSQ